MLYLRNYLYNINTKNLSLININHFKTFYMFKNSVLNYKYIFSSLI